MATLFANPRYTPVDAQGDPYPGATLTFYAAGTTTPQAVYTTSALTTPHPSPVTANSAGQFPAIYYDDALQYRAILRDATGVLLWDIDVINSNLTAEEIGRALYPRSAAEIIANVTPTNYRRDYGDVRRYGAVGNGVTDDREAIERAISVAAAGGPAVTFPPATYAIGRYISCVASNVALIGGPGVLIRHLSTAGGFERDGIRVGNPLAADGGTNNISTPTFVSNVVVRGFRFENVRIGVWCVYAQNVVVEDLWVEGTAACASGNDNDSTCYNITFRNIHMTGWDSNEAPFYVVGFYQTYGFTLDGAFARVGMPSSTNASYLQIENSKRGSAMNCHFDLVNNNANGITVTSCEYVSVSNCSAYRAKDGLLTFDNGLGPARYCTFSDITIDTTTTGIKLSGDLNALTRIITRNCTTDLQLQTDAAQNLFDHCWFNPGGTAVLVEQTPGGNNGINLQYWRGCVGIQGGDTDAFYPANKPAFRGAKTTNQVNATGNGTLAVITYDTEEFDYAGAFVHTTGLFTAPIDGLYTFTGSANFQVDSSSYTSVNLFLRVGSTDYLIDALTTTANAVLSGSIMLRIPRGSVVSLVAQANGGSLNADILGNSAQTWFSGLLVG